MLVLVNVWDIMDGCYIDSLLFAIGTSLFQWRFNLISTANFFFLHFQCTLKFYDFNRAKKTLVLL